MVKWVDSRLNDLRQCCLRLKDGLIFSPQEYGGQVFVHVEVPESAQFFRIGFSEYVFVSLLDGTTSLPEALAIVAQQLGPNALTENQALELMKWMLTNNLASANIPTGSSGWYTSQEESRLRTNRKGASDDWPSRLKNFNPFWLKIPFGSPDGIIRRVRPAFEWIFHPAVQLVTWIAIVIACLSLANNWQAFQRDARFIFDPNHWLWMLAVWALLKIVHEFAHGIACRHFGGEVRKAGLIFVLFAPMAFVDVTPSWRFPSRWKRIAVAGAGMYAEILIAAICIFLWQYSRSEWLSYHLVNVIVMAGFSTLVFNLNPLMRFDGYFIFSDLLQIPNLYSLGSRAVGGQLSWLFFGEKQSGNTPALQQSNPIVLPYGYLALCWRVLICVGLVITASALWEGLGLLLAVLGVCMWLAAPIAKCVRQVRARGRRKPGQVLRAFVVGGFGSTMLAASWYAVPNPFVAQAPCIVELPSSARVRARAEGFVSHVFVHDGQWVEQGEKLLQLQNESMQLRIRELRAELDQSIAKERMALQVSDPNAADLARSAQLAIRKELNELEIRAQDLTITAPTAGQVVARQIDDQIGRFFKAGDPILKINANDSKEVHLAIDADVATSLRRMPPGKLGITFRLGTRSPLDATLVRIEPRAKKIARNLKLIAPYGGPLAVRETSDTTLTNLADETTQDYEYIEPRFHAVARITPDLASQLRAGERGVAVLGGQHPTLGRWAVHQTQDWIRERFVAARTKADSSL